MDLGQRFTHLMQQRAAGTPGYNITSIKKFQRYQDGLVADPSLKDLFDMAGEWKGSNIGNSPLTYLNPRAQLDYSPFGGVMFGLKPAAGWVEHIPGLNNNITFSRKHLPRDQLGLLELLAHESAHTTQPMGLKHKLPDPLLSSAPFTGYGNELFPPAQEILASLREKEALASKGKQWYNTIDGSDYLEELLKANPNRNRQSIVQEVDRKMFPEFGVMHEGPVNPKLQKQQGFLEKLMQMFGR